MLALKLYYIYIFLYRFFILLKQTVLHKPPPPLQLETNTSNVLIHKNRRANRCSASIRNLLHWETEKYNLLLSNLPRWCHAHQVWTQSFEQCPDSLIVNDMSKELRQTAITQLRTTVSSGRSNMQLDCFLTKGDGREMRCLLSDWYMQSTWKQKSLTYIILHVYEYRDFTTYSYSKLVPK